MDRASRYTAAAKTADKSEPTITTATRAVLGVLLGETVKTITFDNGLLRQFFPKGMDFSTVDRRDLDIALELLNDHPRKCLNYRTPTEVFWSESVRCDSD